jgi:hypothetical protein
MSKSTVIYALSIILGIASSACYTATLDAFYLVTMTLAVIGAACGAIIAHDEAEQLRFEIKFEERLTERRNSTTANR